MDGPAEAPDPSYEAVVFIKHFKEMRDHRQSGKVIYPRDEILLLGVPTVADRVAQMAVRLLLEPRLEPNLSARYLRLSARQICARRRGGHAQAVLAIRLGSGI